MTDVFKATYKDQYVQSTSLKEGVYTFHARVMFQSSSPDGKYSISFTDEAGGIHNVNLNWQIEPNIWCDVVQTIELDRLMTSFSLMASPLLPGESVLIGLPQHEEGFNKSTPRANPLDENEELRDEIDLVRTYISSQVDLLEDRITLKVGEYRVGGKNFLRNFDGRFGMDYWNGDAEQVDENGVPIPVTILSVTAPNPISVYAGNVPETPETVKLVLDDGSTVTVPVTWGTIDTSIVGEYDIQGTYSLPEGVTGEMPEVFLKVLVGALTVLSVTPLAQVTVDQYRTPVLPTTIQLNLNNSTSVNAPVTWGSYNTNTPGTFEITAVYDLPSGITGYKPTVKITLVVNEVADTGTFIDVIPYLTKIKNSGTDDWGNWINPERQTFNDIIPYVNPGLNPRPTLYFRYRGTWSNQVQIVGSLVGEPSYYSWIHINIPSGNLQYKDDFFRTYAIGKTIETIYWYYDTNTLKLYNFELRTDGSVPPWYIEE